MAFDCIGNGSSSDNAETLQFDDSTCQKIKIDCAINLRLKVTILLSAFSLSKKTLDHV